MLKRLYIDNFRGCTNLDIPFGQGMTLLLGENGTGKSTVFDVLRKIQLLIRDGEKLASYFSPNDLTRWQSRSDQIFEIEITRDSESFLYTLVIEYQPDNNLLRIQKESLFLDGKPLIEAGLTEQSYEVQLYRDDSSKGPVFPSDWHRSCISLVPSGKDNRNMTWFRERLERFIIARIDAPMMDSISESEATYLSSDMHNFPSWLRHISQDQGLVFGITQDLQDVLDGFSHFKFEAAGENHRVLRASFNGQSSPSIDYRFSELSDGQRSLIALYSLLHYARSSDFTLCLDEPENFVALSEIQPWLIELFDASAESDFQSLLISHHPELINYLAASNGIWFDKRANGPIRVNQLSDLQAAKNGVPVSELVARGWIDG